MECWRTGWSLPAVRFSLRVSAEQVLKDPIESGEFDDARAHRVRVRGTGNTFHDPLHMYSRLVSKALSENMSRVPRQHTPSLLGWDGISNMFSQNATPHKM